jgi:hypothetical protein
MAGSVARRSAIHNAYTYTIPFRYRSSHPDTELGLPGRFQGLNVGVLLLRLDRMRRSQLYNLYLTPAETTRKKLFGRF